MGHKEPLCQVAACREKDKGLKGFDMTNMRGFAGFGQRRGVLALQPGVTDTVDLYHTSEQIIEKRADQPQNKLPAYNSQMLI